MRAKSGRDVANDPVPETECVEGKSRMHRIRWWNSQPPSSRFISIQLLYSSLLHISKEGDRQTTFRSDFGKTFRR